MSPRTCNDPGRGSPGPALALAYQNDISSVARPVTSTDDDTPRCRVCGHTLTADRSVRAGIGPVCGARLAATIAQVTGRPVVVVVLDGVGLVAQLGEVAP